MHRIAYVATHPIQYQAPLLRRLSRNPDLALEVFFLSDFSLREHHEEAFGRSFKWDVPLTDGYHCEVLPRWLAGPAREPKPHWPVFGLRTRLKRGRFDAVWVHGWGQTGLRQAVSAARSLRIPLLLRGESTPDGSRVAGWRRWMRDAFCRRLFRQAAGLLCIGSLNRQFYQSFGVPESKLFLMPYAVDNEFFRARSAAASAEREILRERLGLVPKRPIILFAAKFIPVKAPGDLLAAYLTAYPTSGPSTPYLLFVGDGPLRPALEAQASARLGQDVRLLGFQNQSELPALYDICDLFVLPSLFEPWGLVINEVMNAGKPVLISDRVGSAADLVEAGENGWIFPAGDVASLSAALREACADPCRLLRCGERSLARIEKWDFRSDEQGLLTALRAVTAGRKNGGR